MEQETFRNKVLFWEDSAPIFDDEEVVWGLLDVLINESITQEEREKLQGIIERMEKASKVLPDPEDAKFIIKLAEKYNVVI